MTEPILFDIWTEGQRAFLYAHPSVSRFIQKHSRRFVKQAVQMGEYWDPRGRCIGRQWAFPVKLLPKIRAVVSKFPGLPQSNDATFDTRPIDVSDRKEWQSSFWAKVSIKDDDDCWEWKGKKNHGGYGLCRIKYRIRLAHRVAYSLNVGPIPDGLVLLHSCDNPSCCNPHHLTPGSMSDNIHDMYSKSRSRHGDWRDKQPGQPLGGSTHFTLSGSAEFRPQQASTRKAGYPVISPVSAKSRANLEAK